MRKEETTRLSMWEDELPSPNELIPLTQYLITPTLASAFDLHHNHHPHPSSSSPSPQLLRDCNDHQLQLSSPIPLLQPNSATSLVELGGGYGISSTGGRSEEPARTSKKHRLAWTPELHQKFVDAVTFLGIKNAVPRSIMQLMNVDGLTRENIASHLQKYRTYRKKIQGELGGSSDPTTDLLFSNSAIPPHFLYLGGGGSIHMGPISEPFISHMPLTGINHHQMAATTMGHQSQYQNRHPMRVLAPI